MNHGKIQLNCHTCEGRKNGIFCDLSHQGIENLNVEKITNKYKKDQNLFVEGNSPFGLYCVHSGKVKLTKTNSAVRETIIRLAGPGEVLGHRSLFSETSYSATAKTLEDSVICFVSKTLIMKLIQSDPHLCCNIVRNISEQMGAAENRIASLSTKPQKERFAEMLLLLKEAFGEKQDQEIKLNIKLTREEMGSMIGAASENVIRLITEFKKNGLIAESDKTISILNLAKLEGLANLSY